MAGGGDAAGDAHGSAGHFRWVIVALLFAIAIINYIDRSAISYAIVPISRELGLDDAARGLVLGAFGIGYAVTTLIGGFLVDRFGARRVLMLAVLFWALATGGAGLAGGFVMLLVARSALGVAEGPMFPGFAGAVRVWLPAGERARAFAFSLVAVPLALAIGAPIVSQLIDAFGWRGMFFALAIASLVWLPFWIWLFRDRPQESPHVGPSERALLVERGSVGATPSEEIPQPRPRTAWRALFTNRTLLANYWAFFVFGWYLFFFMSWLPAYLEKVFHLDVREVGWFSLAPWGAAALVLLVVGDLSDRLLKRTGSLRIARSLPILASQAIAALAVLPVAFSPTLAMALVWITLAVAALMGANAVYFAVNVDVAPDHAAGALGIMDFAFALAGFLAPAITGWVLGDTRSFADAFLLLVALAGSSVLVMLLFHRPDRDRLA